MILRRLSTLLATTGLALTGAVVLSSPASAQNMVQCPSPNTMNPIGTNYENAKRHGTMVNEFWSGKEAVTIYRVQNRHEVYITDGRNIALQCFDSEPKEQDIKEEAEQKPRGTPTGGGVGSGSMPVGHAFIGSSFSNTGTVTVGQATPVDSYTGTVTVGPMTSAQ